MHVTFPLSFLIGQLTEMMSGSLTRLYSVKRVMKTEISFWNIYFGLITNSVRYRRLNF